MIEKQRRLVILLALAIGLLGARAGFAEQPPSLVNAAKSEGTVTWYSVLDAPTLDALVTAFNKTHPGIVLRTLRIGSNLMPARVMTERMAGTSHADLVTCDRFEMSQLIDADIFQPIDVPDPQRYFQGAIDSRRSWVALFLDTSVLAWNPQRLKEDGLKPPTSIEDLGKPEWRGKIGIDGNAINWYQGILATHKDAGALLKKIADNKPMVTSGRTAAITQLINGEYDATPTAYGFMAEHARLAGRPIDFVPLSPTPVALTLTGIPKGAPHPNAARVVLDWLLSKPAQQFFANLGRTPIRTDVASDVRVFNPRMPFYVMPAPTKEQYSRLTADYKAIFGIGG